MDNISKIFTGEKTQPNLAVYEKQIGMDLIISNSAKKKFKEYRDLFPVWLDTYNAKGDPTITSEYEIVYCAVDHPYWVHGYYSVEQIIRWLTNPNVSLYDIFKENYPDPRKFTGEKTPDNLSVYEAQIGMKELIKKYRVKRRHAKGKWYKGLYPEWLDEDKTNKSGAKFVTNYDMAYWIEYGDHSICAWFSVEEITRWLTTPELQLATIYFTSPNAMIITKKYK